MVPCSLLFMSQGEFFSFITPASFARHKTVFKYFNFFPKSSENIAKSLWLSCVLPASIKDYHPGCGSSVTPAARQAPVPTARLLLNYLPRAHYCLWLIFYKSTKLSAPYLLHKAMCVKKKKKNDEVPSVRENTCKNTCHAMADNIVQLSIVVKNDSLFWD